MKKTTAIVELMATARALEGGDLHQEGAESDFIHILDEYAQGLVKESDSLPCVSDSDCCHPSIMYINSKWKFFCVECGHTGIESDR